MSQHKFRSVASLFAVALLVAACPVGPAYKTRTLGGTITGLKGTGLVLQFNNSDDLTIDPGATSFQFDARTVDSWSYEVTVLTQPTNPSQTCKVENGTGTTDGADVTSVEVRCTTNTYTVGVSVSRLLGNGAGLVLKLNDGEELPVAVAGKFAFSSKIESGATYKVAVARHPATPPQTCSVSGGNGTMHDADVTSIEVTCTVNTYTVGVSVSRLLGNDAGLVLLLNGREELPVAVAGKFTFSSKLESGATYAVTVAQHPTNPAQTCSVSGGSGTVGSENIGSIDVSCSVSSFTVAVSVQGLAAGSSGLKLSLNGGTEELEVSSNGTSSFTTKLASGSSYLVTVLQTPTNPTQTCSIQSGSGIGGSAAVVNALVTCSTSAYTIGGTVTGLTGTGLILQLNNQYNLALSPNELNFSFPAKVASGATYVVTVTSHPKSPEQACLVSHANGRVQDADIGNVSVTCLPRNSVDTLAGSAGQKGAVDKVGSEARFFSPTGVAVDAQGNIFVADFTNHTIRRITAMGAVSTLAGTARQPGVVDKVGAEARFNCPAGLAVDAQNNLFVADSENHTIRKITPEGAVSTLAGAPGQQGSADGQGAEARFNQPRGVAVDTKGNVFVADLGNHTIRKITPEGVVSTLAGAAGQADAIDKPGAEARFWQPTGVAVDAKGNVFVADFGNNRIRKITPTGAVSTLAGAANQPGGFTGPAAIAVDTSGIIFVADSGNHTIRKISLDGAVSTLAGTAGAPGSIDKAGPEARFNNPLGVAADAFSIVYVADTTNHTIRRIVQ
jgi:sugar lactone lactonase YvrE